MEFSEAKRWRASPSGQHPWHRAPSPLGTATKSFMRWIRSSCLHPANNLFAKTWLSESANVGTALERPGRVSHVTSERSERVCVHESRMQLLPQLLFEAGDAFGCPVS